MPEHSETYLSLTEPDKKKVEAIIAYIGGDSLKNAKRILTAVRMEVENRITLTIQPDFQGLLNHS